VFYGSRDYVDAVRAEHDKLRALQSSYLCTQYLAEHLMKDYALEEPLQVYEHDMRTTSVCTATGRSPRAKREVRGRTDGGAEALLAHQLEEARQAILQMPQNPSKHMAGSADPQASGDTQKLRVQFAMPERIN